MQPLGTQLFGRAYQLRIGSIKTPSQAVYGNTGTDAPLRVAFTIKKGVAQAPNKATVQISNLADINRSRIQPGLLVTLSAGYLGALQTLFVGVVSKASTQRDGPDITTEMEAEDGGGAITQAHLDRSYPAGTTLTQVIADLAAAMQLVTPANPAGMDQGSMQGIPAQASSKGFAVHGACGRILTRMCRANGLQWSIQNNALQILPYGTALAQTAEVLSPKTGLLGVPSRNGQVVTFTCLMNPQLAPGKMVHIQSSTVTGYFKITAGTWQGDSHADKWDAELEATEVPGVVIGLDTSQPFGGL